MWSWLEVESVSLHLLLYSIISCELVFENFPWCGSFSCSRKFPIQFTFVKIFTFSSSCLILLTSASCEWNNVWKIIWKGRLQSQHSHWNVFILCGLCGTLSNLKCSPILYATYLKWSVNISLHTLCLMSAKKLFPQFFLGVKIVKFSVCLSLI